MGEHFPVTTVPPTRSMARGGDGGTATAAAHSAAVQSLVGETLSRACSPPREDDSARTLGSIVCTCEVGETCRTWPCCWRR